MYCGKMEQGNLSNPSLSGQAPQWVLTCEIFRDERKNCRSSNNLRWIYSMSLKQKQIKKFEHSRNSKNFNTMNPHQRQYCTGLNYQVAATRGKVNECPASPVLQEAAGEATFSAIGSIWWGGYQKETRISDGIKRTWGTTASHKPLGVHGYIHTGFEAIPITQMIKLIYILTLWLISS